MNDTPSPRPSLRRQLMLGLLAFVAAVTAAVAVQGLVFNERAERLVWGTLLDNELDHLDERIARDPSYRWSDTHDMALYVAPRPMPAALAMLPPGLHDDVEVDGQERIVLVRGEGAGRQVLTLDITDLEAREADMALTVIGSALTLFLLMGLLAFWAADRLITPLSRIAEQIGALRPDRPGQHIDIPVDASSEIEVIGNALNHYLARSDRFVERERLFIDMASHELRTPVAVIASATDLALMDVDAASPVRTRLERIRTTTHDMQELLSLLLVLARDPARLHRASEPLDLAALLQAIVEDHRHLAEHKDLGIRIDAPRSVQVVAPPQILRAALGNLLRNAIEHSDRGEIVVRLEAPATVVIDDPGHGMTPEEVSAAYARIARGGGSRGGGIGLDLIARLCEHLRWSLDIQSDHGRGTTTTLRLDDAGTPGAR